jgi:hypothetical protein
MSRATNLAAQIVTLNAALASETDPAKKFFVQQQIDACTFELNGHQATLASDAGPGAVPAVGGTNTALISVDGINMVWSPLEDAELV